MLEALPLIVVTFLLLSVFISLITNLQLEEIRAHWEERRCDPLVMIMAQMVPKDPAIDRGEFASENFKFCMGGLIDSAIQVFFAPILKIFNAQLNTAEFTQGIVNTLNKSASSLMTPLTSLFGSFNTKLNSVVYQVIRIFSKILTAMDRVFGIATATIFAGMSMYKGIQNMVNAVIRVILIILGILVALVIFLFFIMFPYIPVILTTIGIISATVIGASAAGMSGAFCVAPGTLVAMKNGWKVVEEIQPGDELKEGIVEGVLVSKGGPCVSIHSVVLSESHLVNFENSWIPASQHPLAQPSSFTPPHLYCLNTSIRTWEVKSSLENKPLTLRDWEELPESEEEDFDWEVLIHSLLNPDHIPDHIPDPLTYTIPCNTLPGKDINYKSFPGRGLVGPETCVFVKGKGYRCIKDVQIGDFVKDVREWTPGTDPEFTEVLGIYKDTSEKVPSSGPTSSIWCWDAKRKLWTHPEQKGKVTGNQGYHLLTQSGTYFLFEENLLIRDFTEVGWNRIHETYSYTSSRLSSLQNRNV